MAKKKRVSQATQHWRVNDCVLPERKTFGIGKAKQQSQGGAAALETKTKNCLLDIVDIETCFQWPNFRGDHDAITYYKEKDTDSCHVVSGFIYRVDKKLLGAKQGWVFFRKLFLEEIS